MMQKIYILVYGRMPTEKAYGIHALNQAKSFFEHGYDVTLVYPKTNNQQTIYESLSDYYQEDFQFKVNEVDFFDITSTNLYKLFPNFLKMFVWIASSCLWSLKVRKKIKNSIIWSTNPAVCYLHQKSNKVIFEKHGEGKRLQKLFIKRLNKEGSYLIGTTKLSYEELKKVNNQTLYLPNGVDLKKFKPNRIKTENITVGYAGMLETYGVDKGVFNSVKSMLKIMNEIQFNVVVIGGPENKLLEIEKLIQKSPHKHNFILKDRISQNELAYEIQKFDIGIVPYPSNSHMELYASPLKIFEYLASGVVPLVSDLTSHKELEYPGIFYFKKNNFDSFYNELRLLLQDSNLDKYKEEILKSLENISLDKRSEKILNFMRL